VIFHNILFLEILGVRFLLGQFKYRVGVASKRLSFLLEFGGLTAVAMEGLMGL
jgi:hypothetical protein